MPRKTPVAEMDWFERRDWEASSEQRAQEIYDATHMVRRPDAPSNVEMMEFSRVKRERDAEMAPVLEFITNFEIFLEELESWELK